MLGHNGECKAILINVGTLWWMWGYPDEYWDILLNVRSTW